MRDFLQQYRALVLAILMVTWPMYTYIASGAQRSQLGPIDRLSIEGFGALQSRTDGVLGSLSDLWEDYIDLVDVKAENERLRLENARLREENIILRGVSRENKRLQRMVDFKTVHPTLKLLAARVIAADVSPYFRVLRLRLDTGQDLVKVGMPVVATEGVVGQVEAVSGSYCDVMLAVDPRSSIDILTQAKRTRGSLRGLGHDRDYLAEIAHLLAEDVVKIDDTVVTSGRGQRFPKELPVGVVRSVDKRDRGLYQTAIVEPLVDFSRLEEVYIITNANQYQQALDTEELNLDFEPPL